MGQCFPAPNGSPGASGMLASWQRGVLGGHGTAPSCIRGILVGQQRVRLCRLPAWAEQRGLAGDKEEVTAKGCAALGGTVPTSWTGRMCCQQEHCAGECAAAQALVCLAPGWQHKNIHNVAQVGARGSMERFY